MRFYHFGFWHAIRQPHRLPRSDSVMASDGRPSSIPRDGTTHDATMMRRDGQSTAHPSVENAAHSSVQPVLTAPTARTPKVNDEHVRPTEKMHSHALHPIPSAQLVCSFHFPISSPQLVCSSHLLISSAQLISSAHLVCQARKFFSSAHVVFPARRFLSLAHLVCPTNHPSMTPCAAQTVAAAHRRAARAIHHDDATSPYPSAMDL